MAKEQLELPVEDIDIDPPRAQPSMTGGSEGVSPGRLSPGRLSPGGSILSPAGATSNRRLQFVGMLLASTAHRLARGGLSAPYPNISLPRKLQIQQREQRV